ncbi:unnamed protein product [Cuscuta europaea]|uniref:CASP-like protein n=1 Tax=Cuscuta europaea TaxID=41803 RepID=A0A9P0ZNQ6_CUSEU|nr:unnamed protein product [Cuscuta europaea]
MSMKPEKTGSPATGGMEKAAHSVDKAEECYPVVVALLRLLLFVSLAVAVVVMVSSKQTYVVVPFQATLAAKFSYSPAFIYFVAALSVAGCCNIISTVLSFYNLIVKPSCPMLMSHFVILDVLLLGIVASATGTAGGVAYLGLNGNSHVGWMKVCNIFDVYCTHIGTSVAVSLFASVILVILIILSIHSLSKKIPK